MSTSKTFTLEQCTSIESKSPVKIINAVAGSGKTAILLEMIRKMVDDYILVLCFNKSIKEELAEKTTFDRNVVCYTFHGFANNHFKANTSAINGFKYRTIVDEYDVMMIMAMFKELKITPAEDKNFFPDFKLGLEKFFQSDKTFDEFFEGVIIKETYKTIFEYLLNDVCAPITHDFYLKIFQLTGYKSQVYTAVLIDEAQDLNPCNDSIIKNLSLQTRIRVGDSHQQIYAFRGAEDSLKKEVGEHFPLSYSFRIGSETANLCNKFIHEFKKELSFNIVGKNDNQGIVKTLPQGEKFAVVSRTNMGLLHEIYFHTKNRKFVHIVGGHAKLLLDETLKLFHASNENPFVFKGRTRLCSIEEARKWFFKTEDKDLKKILNIIETYKDMTVAMITSVKQYSLDDEELADVVATTAHKSKGLQFKNVLILSDFPEIGKLRESMRKGEDVSDEVNLLYVAMTRSSSKLQLSADLESWRQNIKREMNNS
jgi:superfamily I DNA/RNA helicase